MVVLRDLWIPWFPAKWVMSWVGKIMTPEWVKIVGTRLRCWKEISLEDQRRGRRFNPGVFCFLRIFSLEIEWCSTMKLPKWFVRYLAAWSSGTSAANFSHPMSTWISRNTRKYNDIQYIEQYVYVYKTENNSYIFIRNNPPTCSTILINPTTTFFGTC